MQSIIKQYLLSGLAIGLFGLTTCLGSTGCISNQTTTGSGKFKVGFVADNYIYFGNEVDGDKVGKKASVHSEVRILPKVD